MNIVPNNATPAYLDCSEPKIRHLNLFAGHDFYTLYSLIRYQENKKMIII